MNIATAFCTLGLAASFAAGFAFAEDNPAVNLRVGDSELTLDVFADVQDFRQLSLRVMGPDDTLVLDANNSEGSINWNVQDLPDGTYRYDYWVLTDYESQHAAETAPTNAGKRMQILERRSGKLIIEGGQLSVPEDPAALRRKRQPDDLSFVDQWGQAALRVAGALLEALVPTAHAADLIASSTSPYVEFFDERTPADTEWRIFGPRENWYLADLPGDSWPIFIKEYTGPGWADKQFSMASNGDVDIAFSVGDVDIALGRLFVDRSANRVGMGTTTPTQPLHISDAFPVIFMDTIGGTTGDWQLEAGTAAFELFDASVSTRPLVIEVGSPDSSIYVMGDTVAGSGMVGLFTNTPPNGIELTIHESSGSEADLRFQNATQDWNVALGTSDDFVISDVDAATDPFRIENGNGRIWTSAGLLTNGAGPIGSAPLVLGQNLGNRGMGITNRAASNPKQAFFGFEPGHTYAEIVAVQQGVAFMDLAILVKNLGINVTTPSHPLQLASGAHATAGGAWTNASSRAFKENIAELETAQAVATLSGLKPVTFNYKQEQGETYVGFIAEDVPELVATNDRKGLNSMDVVAVLTKVVQQQQDVNERQREIIKNLRNADEKQRHSLVELHAKMNRLEERLRQNEAQRQVRTSGTAAPGVALGAF